MLDLHVAGGMEFMAPLSLLFLVNLGIFVVLLLKLLGKNAISPNLIEVVRQIGMLALAYGVFGTVSGLMQAFGSLAEIEESLPLRVIMGGMKVAMITAVYGLIIFLISFSAFGLIKFFANRKQVNA